VFDLAQNLSELGVDLLEAGVMFRKFRVDLVESPTDEFNQTAILIVRHGCASVRRAVVD